MFKLIIVISLSIIVSGCGQLNQDEFILSDTPKDNHEDLSNGHENNQVKDNQDNLNQENEFGQLDNEENEISQLDNEVNEKSEDDFLLDEDENNINKEDEVLIEKEEVSSESSSLVNPTIISENMPENVVELLNNDIGFVYHNLVTGQRIAHNEGQYFYAASTVKAIIAMQLIDMGADLNMMVQKTSSDFEGGGGKITNSLEFGEYVTLKEVIYEMLVNSDNTATQMAFRVGRADQAWKYAANYSPTNEHARLYNGTNSVTPRYMADAMKYLYENADKYHLVIEYMKLTNDTFNLIDNNTVYAKKPGRFGHHRSQIGIVFSEEPYVYVSYIQNKVTEHVKQRISKEMYQYHISD